MLSKLVLVLGASNLTVCVFLPHASTLRLALKSGALVPAKQITLAGVCNLTLRVTESPMTSGQETTLRDLRVHTHTHTHTHVCVHMCVCVCTRRRLNTPAASVYFE